MSKQSWLEWCLYGPKWFQQLKAAGQKKKKKKQKDQTVESLTPQKCYKMGEKAYNKGLHAEDNPFPHGSQPFMEWERGFEDQIYLEYGQKGLDDYYNNPNSKI